MSEPAAPQAVGQGKRPPIPRPWPRLPLWFRVGAGVTVVAFLVVGAVALKAILGFEEQPLYERRSAPAPGAQSHEVGRVVLPEAPLREVRCNAVEGLRVQGGPDTGPLLEEAIAGLCERLGAMAPYGAQLAERIVTLAKARAIVSFANFGRTGELSTTLPGTPPRILVNDSFLRGGGQFKGFLVPVLAHEMFHGGSAEVDAETELAARKAELAACGTVPSEEAFRGCTDAKAIVDAGDAKALEELRKAGYR